MTSSGAICSPRMKALRNDDGNDQPGDGCDAAVYVRSAVMGASMPRGVR